MPRRQFLQSTAGAAGAAVAAGAVASVVTGAAPAGASANGTPTTPPTPLHLTAATNGAATPTAPHGPLIAEVQNILWAVPRDGSPATALTPPGLEPSRPACSPDGRHIAAACFKAEGGQFHIWAMARDGSGLRRLTDGPWDDRAPAWSPDGTRIAFSSERGGDPVKGSPYRIWSVDVRTGKVTQHTGLPAQQGPGQDGAWEDFDPVWSPGPDGGRIVFVRGTLDGTTLKSRTIAAVPATTTGPVTVEHADPGPGNLLMPALSPAGRRAWLTTLAPAPGRYEQVTLVVDGKPAQVDGEIATAPPRWLDDERLLLTVDGRFRILRPHRDTPAETVGFTATLPVVRPRYRTKTYDFEPERARPVRGIHLPALSPDGRSVAFAALNALWIAPTSATSAAPRKIVQAAPTTYLQGPVWTPDGQALLYVDDRAGLNAVRRHDLSTGDDKALTGPGRVHAALSPDGKRLAALDLAGNLVVRDLASGTEQILAAPLGGGGLPGRPSFSPDGRYLAYCDRNRLNLRFREGYNLIRVVDTTTGASRLHPLAPHVSLSDRYASGPVWSPDGRTMACVSESALWLLPVRPDGTPDGEPRRVTADDEPADHPSWSADSRTLLYLSGTRLRLHPLDGRPRTVPVRLSYRRQTPVDTVVHAGRLWDATGGPVREDVDILIRAGRITAVEPHRPGRRTARRVDASTRTVIPGLWDTHTHPWQYTYGARQTALNLAYGITTTVSLAGFSYEQARLREDITAGRLAGPRLLTTGELLDGSRVAYSMGRAHRTRAGLRRSLSRGEALAWDFVKTYVRAPAWMMEEAARFGHERLGVLSGSHLCSQGVQTGQDLTTHLVATERSDHGHGATAGGLTHQDTVENYTRGGMRLVETPFTATHLLADSPELADDPRVTAMMPPWDAQAVRAQASRTPAPTERLALRREMDTVRTVLKGGGQVALGTDSPLTPVGLFLHLALRALVRHGLTPAEALLTATAIPAKVFGAEKDLGTVEPGRLADLTVIAGDPFTDFDDLAKTDRVLIAGRVHDRADLERTYAGTSVAPKGWSATADQMRRDGCC
ncbi:amidohydrolase family protein [Streptomyces spiramyceticus]|uniref:amidohydrolase family protein n=1 Tax=Streptomyces spiramyceticus TaxID=299717 RepID=UPI00237B5E19|nr:amidohydrolase family protein [Streptomyces spiramyceticus]